MQQSGNLFFKKMSSKTYSINCSWGIIGRFHELGHIFFNGEQLNAIAITQVMCADATIRHTSYKIRFVLISLLSRQNTLPRELLKVVSKASN